MQEEAIQRRSVLPYGVILPASLLSLCMTSAHSASPLPDAGQIFREVKPLPQPTQTDSGHIILPSEQEQPELPASTEKLQVNGFRFTGNDHIGSEQLHNQIPMIGQLTGKRISLSELNRLTDTITRYYREHGYPVAVSYLPAQDVIDGIVSIAILEGKIDNSTVTGNSVYPLSNLLRYLHEALCQQGTSSCTGDVVENKSIQRAIGIISDLPGIKDVTAILSPGSKLGTTNLKLSIVESLKITGQVRADNYGNRYTGRKRLTGNLQINSPFKPGDRLAIDITTSGQGMRFGALNYTRPLGYTGWRAGLGYSSMTYNLGAPFNVTDAHGEAEVLSLHTHYPVIRSITPQPMPGMISNDCRTTYWTAPSRSGSTCFPLVSVAVYWTK